MCAGPLARAGRALERPRTLRPQLRRDSLGAPRGVRQLPQILRLLATLPLCTGLACARADETSHQLTDSALAVGATSAETVSHQVDPTQASDWPSDQDQSQLDLFPTSRQRARVPFCSGTPVATADSIGPIALGVTLETVLRRCPDLYRYWDWGDEGIPQPAVAVQVGGALVRAVLSDSSTRGRVDRIFTTDSLVHTAEGAHPGTTFEQLERVFGTAELGVAECSIFVWFSSAPGLAWQLNFPEEWHCGQAESVGTPNGPRPPSQTRVAKLIVHAPRAGA